MFAKRLGFKRIVCPVDLSPDSRQGLRYAVALARTYQARLFVLHCTTAQTEADSSDHQTLEQTIAGFTREYLLSPTIPALDWEPVIVSGDPAFEIAREAAERQADLITMRSRRRPYAAALLGSVAEAVCRLAPCPTLVTHPGEIEWAGKTANSLDLKRILVAYDFSSDSELALSYGLSFAQHYGAELHVLHVLPTRTKETTPDSSMLPLASATSFSRTFEALKTAVPNNEVEEWSVCRAVREGHPYREVLSYAEDQGVELICMGASGTGFGMRALFGSNADRVLRQAPCPILIARPLRPTFAAQAIAPVLLEASDAFARESQEGRKK